ncbi:MAG: DUF6519 domain-containing protein [Nannocystaceae bacterium]
MSGDYSRRRFDPRKHYSSVLMQQGRVQLDADWNEMAELYERRFRAERVDAFGRTAVPSTGADAANNARAFEVTIDDEGRLRLGRGRIYVDGLLAENHGAPGPARLDPVLDEPHGGDHLPFADQPYYDRAPTPPADRPFVVYLDVWRREVTHVEDPGLVEPALGVDTTTRMQVAWQARFFTDAALTPGSRAGEIEALPAWRALVRPSAARLRVATGAASPGEVDPCVLPPGAGFRSLDNQLYRIELHDGGVQPTSPAEVGVAGRPTFKWSRDNAAIQARVLAVQDDVVLVVDELGRDDVLRIREGDWIELRDDLLEAHRIPGVMARVARCDDEARSIRLHAPLAELLAARPDVQGLGAAFPTVDARRNLRVRRWDQGGEVRDDQGELLVDLSRPASGGVIPVPEAGRFAVLERGIKVAFDTDAGEGPGAAFRAADHWSFAARADDGSIEALDQAPPAGDHHHFALLGLVTLAPPVVSDLRTLIQPPKGEGAGCCTIHVRAEDHNSGVRTIQSALAELAERGGTVCLDVGVYRLLDGPIAIDGGRNLTIRGQGRGTVIARQYRAGPPNMTLQELQASFHDGQPDEAVLLTVGGAHAVLTVSNTVGFALEDLSLVGAEDGFVARYQVAVVNCAGVRIERCAFVVDSAPPEQPGLPTAHAAIVLHQCALGVTIRDNQFAAKIGVAAMRLFTADLRIEGNQFQTPLGGVLLAGWIPTQGARIAGNRIVAGTGIYLAGACADATVEVEGNHLEVRERGIEAALDDVTIAGNIVLGPHARPALGDVDGRAASDQLRGITLSRSTLPVRARIVDNEVRHVHTGVRVGAECQELLIAGNHVERIAAVGVDVDPIAATSAVIRGNTLRDLGFAATPAEVVGVRVQRVESIVIDGNHLERIGVETVGWPEGARVYGVAAQECLELAITGNQIRECGPPHSDPLVTVMAISARMFQTHLEVARNLVTRRTFRGASLCGIALFVQQEPSVEDRPLAALPAPEGGRLLALGDRTAPIAGPGAAIIADNHFTALWSPATLPRLRELRSDGQDLIGMPIRVECLMPLSFTRNRLGILTPPNVDRNNLFVGELRCPWLTLQLNHWTHSGGVPGPYAPTLRLLFRSLVHFGETQEGIQASADNGWFGPQLYRDSAQNLGLPSANVEPYT